MSSFDASSIFNLINIASQRAARDARTLVAGRPVLGSSVYNPIRDAQARLAESQYTGYNALSTSLNTSASKLESAYEQFGAISTVLDDMLEAATAVAAGGLTPEEMATYDAQYQAGLAQLVALRDETSGGKEIINTSSYDVMLNPFGASSVELTIGAATLTELNDLIDNGGDITSQANALTELGFLNDAVTENTTQTSVYATNYETVSNFSGYASTTAGDYADLQADYEYYDSTALATSIALDEITVEQGYAMVSSLLDTMRSQADWIAYILTGASPSSS